MKKQLLSMLAALALVLGCTSFVGAMEKPLDINNVEDFKKIEEMRKEVTNEILSNPIDPNVHKDAFGNSTDLIKKGKDENENNNESNSNILVDEKDIKINENDKNDINIINDVKQDFEQYKNNLLNKNNLLIKKRSKLGLLVSGFSTFGFGGAGLVFTSLFVATLFHLIAQGLVTAKVLEKIVTNKHVIVALNKIGIKNPQAFFSKLVAFEQKTCEAKWFNWLQKGNKSFLTLFILEACLCAGCGLASAVSFALAVVSVVFAGGCGLGFMSASKALKVLNSKNKDEVKKDENVEEGAIRNSQIELD